MTQNLKLMEKYYQTAIINTFENLQEKVNMREQMMKLSIELQTIKESNKF